MADDPNPDKRRRDQQVGAVALAVVLVFGAASCSSESPGPAEASRTAATALPSSSAGATTSTEPTPANSDADKTEKEQVLLPKLDNRNAIAFAPLGDPGKVKTEGSVSDNSAWSTSKVLVVLAYIDKMADGDPDKLSGEQKELIRRALTASDMNALLTLRGQIPGGSGATMTQILRSIGDNQTAPWPDSREGSHQWSIQNQVKFMAALDAGKVVSPEASKYVLATMRPIPEHSWGLGTIGADAFKGGWLTPDTDTRQMGIVDGYSVAIITDGVGPAVVQTDGDSAHVRQMNKLAKILKRYLDAESDSG